jgi:succinyl-CoA synthetase beta subunit
MDLGRVARIGVGAGLLMAAAGAIPAQATPAEARSVAIASNCKPGKIEAVRQFVGGSGETVFKVMCTGGKSKDVFVLVQCRVHQCVLLR